MYVYISLNRYRVTFVTPLHVLHFTPVLITVYWVRETKLLAYLGARSKTLRNNPLNEYPLKFIYTNVYLTATK